MLASAARVLVTMLTVTLAARVTWSYDPRTEWRTLLTESLQVHYPVGRYDTAVAAAQRGEVALARLSARLGWVPTLPVHLVINDETDNANGFAQAIPYNLIGANNAAPDDMSTLSDYEDWLDLLITHEMAHIVHIDTVRGPPRLFGAIFGRWLVPNGVQPRWMVEGLATYYESALSGGGRVRASSTDMVLRMAVLEDALFDLGQVSGFPWAWPQGHVPYLYGGLFVDYLARRFGEDALRRVSFDYGAQLLPFGVNVTARHVFGEDYDGLYADFVTELRGRYGAALSEVKQAGRHEGELIIRRGHRGQDVGPARMSQDGTMYFVAAPIDDHAALYRRDAAGNVTQVTRVYADAELALLPGAREALLTQDEVTDLYRVHGDLFRVDLATGRKVRLTQGARVSGPDVSPDGATLVFVQADGGHMVLREASVAQPTRAQTLVDLGPETQLWTPRFSPDGRSVVFAGMAAGRRDIYLYDRATRHLNRLTDDRALDGAPVFTIDGSAVLYHSDRDGIYNLYVQEVAGGAPRRLTRVLGGAFYPEPWPDGRTVLYRSYSSRGFDLARIDLPAVSDLPPATEPSYDRPSVPHRASAVLYPSRPYGAWETLRPRGWLPLSGVDTRGGVWGLTVQGADALALHSYFLQGWYGTVSRTPGFFLSYTNRQFHPGVTLDVSRQLGFAAVPYVRDGVERGVEEDVWAGRISTGVPLWLSRERMVQLIPSYELRHRRARVALQVDPLDATSSLPDEGRFASVGLQLTYSSLQRYLSSISFEEGTRATAQVRLESPLLGSEYRSWSVSGALTRYVRIQPLSRHVLMLDVFGGYGRSNYKRSRLFAIAGLPTRDLLLDAYQQRFAGTRALRGYPLVPYAGDLLLSGTVEYRLPFYDIERGVGTLPIYFGALHGALFVDGAAIADGPRGLRRGQHYSAGLEGRLDLVVGYALPVSVRVGYGRSIGPDRFAGAYAVLGTVW